MCVLSVLHLLDLLTLVVLVAIEHVVEINKALQLITKLKGFQQVGQRVELVEGYINELQGGASLKRAQSTD